METPLNYTATRAIAVPADFFRQVYTWMGCGLLLTALAAYVTLSSTTLLELIFGNKMVFYGLILGELGLVIWLSAAINKLSAKTATLMFLAYSALNGVTFASIFLIYTKSSIVSTFMITAGTFGAMSAYGYLTKKDLSSWGSFLFMGLIGVVIASVVNIFMQSSMVYWVSTFCGVIVFVGLTAYDTHKIKQLAAQGFSSAEDYHKGAIMGALRLYLDFINLFLMLLRIFGNRR
ncbi:MAG: Bax inhibitor-1/YccA family protein [Desulfuromonadales bacterium]|nr:Bax inhibitor-1/YccA family protein [Desulfuromonadales bacterium]MDT8423572.1 Bax inhibitor-1/YccA family protein [Desulfuromonadales bacterium]